VKRYLLLAALGVFAITGLHCQQTRTDDARKEMPPAVVRAPIPVPIEKNKTLSVTLSDKGMRMAQSLVHERCPPLTHEEAFATLWAWARWKRGEIEWWKYDQELNRVWAAAVMRVATR
jgi:hypothetical protein